MVKNIRFALLALCLLAVPAGFAAAQTASSDAGNSKMAPNGSVVGDNRAAAANPRQPGATGETIVKGDSSTIQGDRKATSEQKSGTMSQ
ncbi:MAG TPA: hypothetical protein DDZ81_01875 [Acetobacteraceae bacterium]|nr:hypothetical protein [Acetobacteraceae bacterium]